MSITIGRNDPCHCGSGKKYKKCHLEKDEVMNRKEREKAALNAAKVAEAEAAKNEKEGQKKNQPAGHTHADQPGWMKKVAGKVGFFKNLTQRRTPSANKGG
ncbi:MAG: hypothetical protein KCHDKBKB_00323 [Elusimicrobia bacterium]|nr:hypothetical protein [Elusimicrobiota bacterium]